MCPRGLLSAFAVIAKTEQQRTAKEDQIKIKLQEHEICIFIQSKRHPDTLLETIGSNRIYKEKYNEHTYISFKP